MGNLTYINGDLFDTDCPIICHSVNCKGVFGAGVAKQIAEKFPWVKQAYLRKHRQVGWSLGEVQFVIKDGLAVVNMATQDSYGRGGNHTDYGAVRLCLEQVFCYAQETQQGVAMPLIGCGLGGGKWPVVVEIIRGLLLQYEVLVKVYFL